MNFLSKFCGSKFARRSEDASVLASSRLRFSEDEKGIWTFRKADGELNLVNNVTRREDGIAVIHVDGALVYRGDEEAYWYGLDS